MVSSQAFDDPKMQPSLYRHDLCEAPPESNPPRMSETDGVLHLSPKNIRQIKLSAHFPDPTAPKGKIEKSVSVQLEPDPEPHPSHAIVITEPALPSSRSFQKLQQKLRDQADWALEPDPSLIAEVMARPKP